MLIAPRPLDEAARHRALHELMILDTPPEERFDRIARFAADELGAPVALVALLDGDRQWFKARIGTDVHETPRDISFCSHAVLQPELFIVGDATQDERFADNPLVTGDLHIRFYAGAPLSAPSGERIGTLCVLDTEPREIGEIDHAILRALRDLANEALAGGGRDAP